MRERSWWARRVGLGGQPGALPLRFFFYGTLMGGLPGAALEFIGPAQVRGDLLSIRGAFPGLIDGLGTVTGELWAAQHEDHALQVLQLTDSIESYKPEAEEESMYLRRRVRLVEPDGAVAWTYFWNRSRHGLEPIPSGSWRTYCEERVTAFDNFYTTGRRSR